MKILILLLLFQGCALKVLTTKSGPRAKDETFYDFTDKPGIIFHRKCKDKKKKKCVETEFNIIDDWSFFKDARFIIIPEKYIF